MTKFPSRVSLIHASRHASTRIAAVAVALAVIAGCSSKAASRQPLSTVSDSDYGRLSASQTRPVDEARAQLSLARDELGRAKLGVVNDQHEGELALADQATASADVTRAAAESRIGKDSNEPVQMQQARDDSAAAQLGKQAADARLEYSKKLAASRAAQVTAAERKVDLMTEKVNFAKLQSLDNAAIPAAGKYDRAAAMQRVVDAQRTYDSAVVAAATAAGETAATRHQWQSLIKQQ